jgi:PAS domain S-box-containing protein
MSDELLHEFSPDGSFRCTKCGKMLAKNSKSDSLYEIKCSRCGNLNIMFEEMLEQVVVTDPNGFILYANGITEQLSGYTRAEIIGNRPSLWGGQMPKEFYVTMWKTIKEEKKSVRLNVRNKKKTGEFYDAVLSISPILDAVGEIALFVGIERLLNQQEKVV